MKIAILHSGDLKAVSLGGVDRYIKSLITFFEDGEITIFGTTVKGEHSIGEQYEYYYSGKKFYFVPIIDDHKYPLSIRYMIKELFWLSKLADYDCIYAQRTEYSLPFLISRHKNKLIEMIHGSSRYSEIFWGRKKASIHLMIEKIAIRTARKTFVILNRDEFGAPYYRRKYSKYKERIEYGLNPIDLRVYHPMDKEKNKEELKVDFKKVILFVGRIENNPKRVMLFPDIMKRVLELEQDCGFIVIGDGSDKKQLEKMIADYDLQDRFIFTGYLDDSSIIAKYNCVADVSINISMFEGTCTSVLESIACGIPVVSTDVGDIHECISNKQNGVIIPNDTSTIVDNASAAIIDIFNQGMEMNDVFNKYSGDEVIKSLRSDIKSIME